MARRIATPKKKPGTQKQANKVTTIVTTTLIVGAFFVLRDTLSSSGGALQIPAGAAVSSADALEPGQPCDPQRAVAMDTRGLQCDHAATQGTDGIWVVAQLRPHVLGSLLSYMTRWNSYATPDGAVSFLLPKMWTVHAQTWKTTHRLSVGGAGQGDGASDWIQIEKRSASAGSMDDALRQIGQHASQTRRTAITLNGVSAIRIDAASKDSQASDDVYLLLPRADGYIYVHAAAYHDPYYDFPIEAVLETLKVR